MSVCLSVWSVLFNCPLSLSQVRTQVYQKKPNLLHDFVLINQISLSNPGTLFVFTQTRYEDISEAKQAQVVEISMSGIFSWKVTHTVLWLWRSMEKSSCFLNVNVRMSSCGETLSSSSAMVCEEIQLFFLISMLMSFLWKDAQLTLYFVLWLWRLWRSVK